MALLLVPFPFYGGIGKHSSAGYDRKVPEYTEFLQKYNPVCARPSGKELIGRTNDLTDAGRKSHAVGMMTPQRKIKNLPGIYPNDRPDSDPATAASPEGRRVQILTRVQLDTGCVREEPPEVVGPWASEP